MQEEREVNGAASAATTLLALGCYTVTINWILHLHHLNAACKNTGFPVYLLFVLLFLGLAARHLWTWRKPWPAGSAVFFGLYAAVILMIALSWGLYDGMIRKSVEGATRRELAELRSKLAEAYRREGGPIQNIDPALGSAPELRLPYTPHDASSGIRVSSGTVIQDSGRWYYDGGELLIDCTHADIKGRPWSSY